MKRFLIPSLLSLSLVASEEPPHQYKKRPCAIKAMTEVQINNYEQLAHQRALQYALHLHRKWLKRIQLSQRTAIHNYKEDEYKAF